MALRSTVKNSTDGRKKICEYLEKEIYTIDVFTKRNSALTKEMHELQKKEADLLNQHSEENREKQVSSQIIPTTQHILGNYSRLNVQEKNQLWKLVMKKVTIYRSPEDELTLNIYPNLPQ